MNIPQVFHMKGGKGETSYAKNSTLQRKILSMTKPFIEAAMQDYLSSNNNADFPMDNIITVAELGCSSGATALEPVTWIMDAVDQARRHVTNKFMVYLVDLPGNDFNEVFTLVEGFQKMFREKKSADFGPCFIAGLPGNFYGRLLPNQTLNFVHSSSSLHWLSQVPEGLNDNENKKMQKKGEIYISVTSPSYVINAYKLQFRKDFLLFLVCRSEEVVSGGRMVLAFMGRKSNELTSEVDSYPWNFIAKALMTMVSEGLIEEEKMDSFSVPFYAPCLEEVKQLIEEESSFNGDYFEAIEFEWDGESNNEEPDLNSYKPRPWALTRGVVIAKMHRAVIESMLENHFGPDIIDELFLRYGKVLADHLLSNKNSKFCNLIISVIRK